MTPPRDSGAPTRPGISIGGSAAPVDHGQPEPWYGTRQIARHLGVHVKTVLRLVHTRGLPTHRLGNRLRFKPSEVDRWLRLLGEED